MSYSCRGLMEVLCSIESNKPVYFDGQVDDHPIDEVVEHDTFVELRSRPQTKETE